MTTMRLRIQARGMKSGILSRGGGGSKAVSSEVAIGILFGLLFASPCIAHPSPADEPVPSSQTTSIKPGATSPAPPKDKEALAPQWAALIGIGIAAIIGLTLLSIWYFCTRKKRALRRIGLERARNGWPISGTNSGGTYVGGDGAGYAYGPIEKQRDMTGTVMTLNPSGGMSGEGTEFELQNGIWGGRSGGSHQYKSGVLGRFRHQERYEQQHQYPTAELSGLQGIPVRPPVLSLKTSQMGGGLGMKEQLRRPEPSHPYVYPYANINAKPAEDGDVSPLEQPGGVPGFYGAPVRNGSSASLAITVREKEVGGSKEIGGVSGSWGEVNKGSDVGYAVSYSAVPKPGDEGEPSWPLTK